MKDKYSDLIEQTFEFPTEEFKLSETGNLSFHDINLMQLVEEYGSPLKFTYLPKISENIARAKAWFEEAFKQNNYSANYRYCYCTKSSHFKFVLEEALKNDIHLETSSAFDLELIKKLIAEEKVDTSQYIICNGFKTDLYLDGISALINLGFRNCYPIIDNRRELDRLVNSVEGNFNIGIRIASEEDPKFEFYTSRLGMGYQSVINYYNEYIQPHPAVRLKMLHFFINTGITDTAYYWNELHKCLKVYIELKKTCPHLDSLNIGGGFPIKRSLNFDYDYQYMISEIVHQIKTVCATNNVEIPDIFTEFGSFTVGESGGIIYSILDQKLQNDREKWNMIDGSFMTTLPDAWAINHRFIMLPINNWNRKYERVLLGGLTCDSDDYYNAEQHVNAIYLPEFKKSGEQYIGFFNTGAYQENLGGFGGIKHCLIPSPKHLLIQNGEDGQEVTMFKESQTAQEMMSILGY